MQSLTKISFGLMVISFAGLAGLSRLSFANDCEPKFYNITPEQRVMFNIDSDECRPATLTLPTHAFIVGGCPDCDYDDATGALRNSLDLNKIPTSWILKVPKGWNGRAVVNIPSGGSDHVAGSQSVVLVPLLNEGYAIAAMNHPLPGFPGFDYLTFVEPPYHTHDFRNEYFATGHLLRDLISAVFGNPIGFYATRQSRGTFTGNELF